MFLRWRGELIFYAWVDLCDNQTALKSEPDELASVVVREPAVAEKTETDEATPLTQDALKVFLRQYEAKQNEVNAGIMAELKAMKEWREQVDARSSAGSRSSLARCVASAKSMNVKFARDRVSCLLSRSQATVARAPIPQSRRANRTKRAMMSTLVHWKLRHERRWLG